MYSAAEGRPPFESDNALGTLTAVISDPVTPLSVGGPLALAVDGLLRKDPQDRAGFRETRELLTQATADPSAGATATASATVALDRASRTEALPAGGVREQVRETPPPAAPPPTRYDKPKPRRGALLAAALVVALLVIGGLVYAALNTGDDPGTEAESKPSSSPSSSSSAPDPSTSSSAPQQSESSSAPPADNGVPAGYQLYEDPTGFSVAVPEDWAASQSSATAVDIKSPDGSSFLRVDQTSEPKNDAKKAWEQQEKSTSKDLPNYQRISIETVEYNGWDAADWEFTFGNNTHVLNRGFVTDPNHGYALYLSSREDQWDANQEVFQTAADTFQPAG